ncbi:MAG TPA: M23 family metallopeptidase [Rhizomicrobium sp.]|jgi:murein DD-endopeptidase MepM/ murein hydrolase activator NlpD|nr:M23 family metallopeptidase [Rhizomicrobium sp.]
MIARRAFFAVSAAALACPRAAFSQPSRLTFKGSLEQGSLVVGRTQVGAHVTFDGAPLLVSPAGDFAFGFTYDQTGPAQIAARYADGTSEIRAVQPVARHYETQPITGLPEKFVTLPPGVLERRKREIAAIAAARTNDTDADWFVEPFDWPARGIISGVFGSRRILNGKPMEPHFGVDIAAPAGTPIAAPAPARVALAGPDYYLEGGLTILDHGHGVTSCYLHQSKQVVKVGDRVMRGQVIGEVGMTGRATGPHVHWGLNWFQMRLDPSRSTRTPAPVKA